ncbi:hypothetical protein Hanom_Chr07g00596111 [Helianthus anomalus]
MRTQKITRGALIKRLSSITSGRRTSWAWRLTWLGSIILKQTNKQYKQMNMQQELRFNTT